MALSKKQIKYILENSGKHSAERISKDLNVPLEEVNNIIKSSAQKAPFYFYIILILIPVLLIVMLEIGLRVVNYGYDLTMWVNVTKGKLILNPDVARRYFSYTKNIPSSIEDIFDEEKKENSFRVFVLGGSSAAGYPHMPMGSFSRYIRKRLELAYPSSNIEVINISLSATNTYTIRDFVPGVIEQKPDLVLIYAGHNEYYGALGVGSLESVGSSRELINLMLFLNKFKTTQLVKNTIQWFSALLFSAEDAPRTGTLMSRMAKEQAIELDSKNYLTGIDQFEKNMGDILLLLNNAEIHVIISTLASNLKDQFPFISIRSGRFPPADSVFKEARKEFSNGNFKTADSLFRYAKDLDGLRFRAPEDINNIIKKLSVKFNMPLIDVDSLYRSVSPGGIVGNNLMTDHLHPALKGYHMIGKLFYEKMTEKKYLPNNAEQNISAKKLDSMTIKNFVFSKFDSITSEYRIKLLKNDWPFIHPKYKKSYYEVCRPSNFLDSMSVKFLLGDVSWGNAVESTADWFFKNRNLDGFLEYMRTLIYQYPIIVEYYAKLEEIALRFLKNRDYHNALKILSMEYELRPNAFSSKWMGQIYLNDGNITDAIKYLEVSITLDPADLQTQYNLAGAYALKKEYDKSIKVIEKVLTKEPAYPGAVELYDQLKKMITN